MLKNNTPCILHQENTGSKKEKKVLFFFTIKRIILTGVRFVSEVLIGPLGRVILLVELVILFLQSNFLRSLYDIWGWDFFTIVENEISSSKN